MPELQSLPSMRRSSIVETSTVRTTPASSTGSSLFDMPLQPPRVQSMDAPFQDCFGLMKRASWVCDVRSTTGRSLQSSFALRCCSVLLFIREHRTTTNLEHLHRRNGSLSWCTNVQPSVHGAFATRASLKSAICSSPMSTLPTLLEADGAAVASAAGKSADVASASFPFVSSAAGNSAAGKLAFWRLADARCIALPSPGQKPFVDVHPK